MATSSTLARAPFVLIPQHFGCLVFDRGTSKYLPFDAETTDLLRRAKEIPFSKLLASLPEGGVRKQAWGFFNHFYELGFFTTGGLFAGEVLDITPPPDHMAGPLAVHLEVVAACNLRCTHCFAGDLPRKERPLELAELDALFRSMAGMGSFRLGLTGGEPLLRRDIFEIVDMATAHGLHPCLTTNALLITEEIAREFGRRELVWLNVSLEGATAETNDRVRGPGTFERVLEKLRVLARHARFTLAFTIMSTNADEVAACADLAYAVGASTAVFRPLYPVGTATQHLEALMPTFDQYSAALQLLTERESDARVIDPFSPQMRGDTQAISQTNYGCGAANYVCSISVGGDVNPCSFLGPSFVAANVRAHPLEQIWHASETFRAMRALPGGTPDTFSGGCRARSLVLSGDANAPDPWLERQSGPRARGSSVTFYEPGAIVELAGRPERGCG